MTRRLVGAIGADQAIALLRLVAVGLFAAAERLPPTGDQDVPFFAVLGVYLVWSIGVAVRTWRRKLERAEGVVISAVDVAAISALSALSGGPYSLVRLGYFFVPVTVAFRYRPSLTLAATGITVALFVLQPVVDLGPAQGEEAGYVAVWAGLMAWIGVACAILSGVVARRIRDVTRLTSEVMETESRERQRLAEGLHDGAIQSVLAVRHDLEHVAVATPDSEELARADEALLEVVRQLRSTIFEMHPHVLEAAGLAAAVRQVAELAARRGEFELTLDLDESSGQSAGDRVLFSVFRELITNVVKHAGAQHVTITLRALPAARLLTVADDGRGFDPDLAEARASEGHIGLPSQRVRLETVGGSLEISAAERGGTVAVARVPV